MATSNGKSQPIKSGTDAAARAYNRNAHMTLAATGKR
jgi:outer membrane protein OmpA-like peptidoglycan-associated protein